MKFCLEQESDINFFLSIYIAPPLFYVAGVFLAYRNVHFDPVWPYNDPQNCPQRDILNILVSDITVPLILSDLSECRSGAVSSGTP